jgi:parallel beta-helix repeat protein
MATYYVDASVGSDSNAGTSAGSGGAWLTIGHAAGAMGQGDVCYVKASAVYPISATITLGSGSGGVIYGTATRIVGYTATPGDGGRATVRATAAVVGLTITGSGWAVEGLFLDGNSTGTQGVAHSSSFGATIRNCKIANWTAEAVSTTTSSIIIDECEVTACGGTNGAIYGNGRMTVRACDVHGNTGVGIYLTSTGGGTLIRNLVRSNGSHGINVDSAYPVQMEGNTVHGNAGDGLRFGNFWITPSVQNNIFTSNGGYGFNAVGKTSAGVDTSVDYNWYGSGALANTSGARSSSLSAGPHDLSGDPGYTNATAGDFTPTNVAVKAGSP